MVYPIALTGRDVCCMMWISMWMCVWSRWWLCVYLVETNVCVSRRDLIMMPWHNTIRIIIPIRILIRFCDFGINKVAELLHANHKIIGKNHLSGSIQFGDFFRSKNSFHDNWGGDDKELEGSCLPFVIINLEVLQTQKVRWFHHN